MYIGGIRALVLPLLLVPCPSLAAQVVQYGCQAQQILEQFDPHKLDHMGQSMAIGGDFNHDGRKDIVLGGYNRPPIGSENHVTRVFVFLGTGDSDGPYFRHALTLAGPATLDLFGFSVAFIGDLNGDQCDELVVGAPRFDGSGLTDSGRVSIFFGNTVFDALSTEDPIVASAYSAQNLCFDGTVSEGWFGASLATVRDGTGALQNDLLIGAPGKGPVDTTSLKGSVYQIGPSTMTAASTVAGTLPGVSMGASSTTGTPGVSGSAQSGYLVTAHRILCGDDPGDRFGHSLAFVNNIDGEPGQEFLVGAPQFNAELDPPKTMGPGYVQLFTLGSQTPLVTIHGTQCGTTNPRLGGEAFGFSIAGGLQLNNVVGGDSVPDFLVGAPLFNAQLGSTTMEKAGRVIAFSGQAAANGDGEPLLVDDPVVNGTIFFGGTGDQFGFSVAGVPDLDGNNLDEVLVGACQAKGLKYCDGRPFADAFLQGYAYLFFPGTTDPHIPKFKFFAERERDHMGRSVAAGQFISVGSEAISDILLSGCAWTDPDAVDPDPTEVGRGYVWVGESLFDPD